MLGSSIANVAIDCALIAIDGRTLRMLQRVG